MQGHPDACLGSSRKRQLGGSRVQIQAAGILPSPYLLQQPNPKPSSGGEPELLTDPLQGLKGCSEHLCHTGIDGNQASVSIMEETAKIMVRAYKTMPRSSRRSPRDHKSAEAAWGQGTCTQAGCTSLGRGATLTASTMLGAAKTLPPVFPHTRKAGRLQGNIFSA